MWCDDMVLYGVLWFGVVWCGVHCDVVCVVCVCGPETYPIFAKEDSERAKVEFYKRDGLFLGDWQGCVDDSDPIVFPRRVQRVE